MLLPPAMLLPPGYYLPTDLNLQQFHTPAPIVRTTVPKCPLTDPS